MITEKVIIVTSADLLRLMPGQNKDETTINDFKIESFGVETAHAVLYIRNDGTVKILKDYRGDFCHVKPDGFTAEILQELATAEAKHSWANNSLEKNGLILAEESGEVAQAILNYGEGKGTIEKIHTELIQTAAMCLRNLKNLAKFAVRTYGPHLRKPWPGIEETRTAQGKTTISFRPPAGTFDRCAHTSVTDYHNEPVGSIACNGCSKVWSYEQFMTDPELEIYRVK